jgi:hypothetical protein
MTGARKKIDEKGFEVAGFLRRRICVSAQRKPEKKAAESTRMNPRTENATSPKTIMMTPIVIVVMMPTSRHAGFSRRKAKAKRRTNARDDDLHMADMYVRKVDGKYPI